MGQMLKSLHQISQKGGGDPWAPWIHRPYLFSNQSLNQLCIDTRSKCSMSTIKASNNNYLQLVYSIRVGVKYIGSNTNTNTNMPDAFLSNTNTCGSGMSNTNTNRVHQIQIQIFVSHCKLLTHLLTLLINPDTHQNYSQILIYC